ncbi:MAG TPA: PEP-CTERM sorting domain-containing protein [Pyrinomonadaceae bacterium]
MRTSLRKLGAHVFLLLLTLCAGGWFSTVSADPATFSANLTVNLTFPAPIPGVLAVGIGAGPVLPLCAVIAVGQAAGVCANPTSNFAANTLTFTAGPINGNAGPGAGFVFASSSGVSHTITLTNLGAAPLNVALGGNYNFNLRTTALAGEFARASVFFQIINESTGAVLFGPIASTITSPPNAQNAAAVIFGFSMILPPGATDVTIDPFVQGQAATIPEPTTLILLGTGLAGVAFKTRKRLGRKSGK